MFVCSYPCFCRNIDVCEDPSLNVGFRTLMEQKQDILAKGYPLITHINNLNFIPVKFRGQI